MKLPMEARLPEVLATLEQATRLVIEAPPGAGKTTLTPPALLKLAALKGKKILVTQPRRLAARAAACRVAELLGEEVGETVGYRARLETRVGPKTRIEFLTGGILTRALQDNPELPEVGAVIFDEFHERRLVADLEMAFCLEIQESLRPDLRLLVMSATLNGPEMAAFLGNAPLLAVPGKMYPVETRYAERPIDKQWDVIAATTTAVRRALSETDGGVLAFLPGEREIRRTAERLRAGGLPETVVLQPLYGEMPLSEQAAAIRPAPPGHRKIVLSTSIAETSLTIEDVRAVVDSGLTRSTRFDPVSGLTRLETFRVSRAAAEQRRGRAGRVAPGVCYRLWPENRQQELRERDRPEILDADLTSLALELALWGPLALDRSRWLDPPPPPALARAKELSRYLGAIDGAGKITALGRETSRLGTDPRLAKALLKGRELGLGAAACDLAAILSERDFLRSVDDRRDPDLRVRMACVRDERACPAGFRVDSARRHRVRSLAEAFRRQLRVKPKADDIEKTGLLLAFAYPDRIGRRREGSDRVYQLSNGRGAAFRELCALTAHEFLVAASLDAGRENAAVHLAAPLDRVDLEYFRDAVTEEETVVWDPRTEAVLARRRTLLGQLVLKEGPARAADPDRVAAAMIEGIRRLGLVAFPADEAFDALRDRVAFCRKLASEPADWPDVSAEGLLRDLENWLGTFLRGATKRDDLKKVDLKAALWARLSSRRRADLERLAPERWRTPAGSWLRLDYSGDTPSLSVKIQELFGGPRAPTVGDGRVPVTLKLLSPAGRPVQITADLDGFWKTSYALVKKELKGRYPRHPWPDDPLQAPPTTRAKPRGT